MHDEIAGVFSDLGDAVREPPRFVIEGVLPCGIVFVSGPPKSKKTTLEMAFAVLVAGYKNIKVLPEDMQNVVETGRVLILTAEHTAGELRFMVEDGMGIKVLNDKSILIADDPWKFRLDDPSAEATLIGWLDMLKPKVFIIDPLVDFHSVDEKESGEMNRLLRPYQRWAKENDACFMVIHHVSKKKSDDKTAYKANEMRGTGALFGIADGVLMLTPMADDIIHIEATLKRGAPWTRAIKLGVWGADAEEAKPEPVETLEDRVFSMLKEGSRNYEVIAKSLRVAKSKVVLSVRRLHESKRIKVVGKNIYIQGD